LKGFCAGIKLTQIVELHYQPMFGPKNLETGHFKLDTLQLISGLLPSKKTLKILDIPMGLDSFASTWEETATAIPNGLLQQFESLQYLRVPQCALPLDMVLPDSLKEIHLIDLITWTFKPPPPTLDLMDLADIMISLRPYCRKNLQVISCSTIDDEIGHPWSEIDLNLPKGWMTGKSEKYPLGTVFAHPLTLPIISWQILWDRDFELIVP
jgi:hypothetical protein